MIKRLEQFSPPLLNSKILKRGNIIKQIDTLSGRGILFIHAPAGYGKTTAASQWAKRKKDVWISLDRYSAVPVNFYKSILMTLSIDIDLTEFGKSPLEYTLDAIQNTDEYPDALIIDDFHICTDSSVICSLPLIRARMPASSAFIILSRNPPPDLLAEYKLKGTIKQITDLRFNIKEIVLLFAQNGIYISKYESELLYSKTDGWAAALSAVLMSGTVSYSGVLNCETINYYLKNYVFDSWKDYSILKKCSVCDVLTPGLCTAITGQFDAWEVVVTLAEKTGLVEKLGDKVYRFHALLKEFLELELRLDESIDKPALYKAAAEWYRSKKDWFRTLDMAAKSEDMNEMEKISRITSEEYGTFGINIPEYIKFVENNFLTIPVRTLEHYPNLSGHCYMAALLNRTLEDLYVWEEILEKQTTAGFSYHMNNVSSAFLLALNPRRSSWHVTEQFKRISKILTCGREQPNVLTLTVNFPFFHRAQRDYTDISPQLSEYISEVTRYMKPFLGRFFDIMILLLKAGICYECGRLAEAEYAGFESVKASEHFPPEIRFASLAIYFEIMRVQGKNFDTARISRIINETKAQYLYTNFKAYITNTQLCNGITDAAKTWLAHSDLTAEPLRLYKIYQYFTTARALMVAGQLYTAEKFLEKLAIFSQSYRRNADYIEALVLGSICKWHLKHQNEAVNTIIPAIIKSAELKIVMPIAKENHDILPILQKILNRLKRGYDNDILDKAFVTALFLEARRISKHMRGMFSQTASKCVKLSSRQTEVLSYLKDNLSYREMSRQMNVKPETVNDHIKKLYGKLNVSNSHDALLKAKELGII